MVKMVIFTLCVFYHNYKKKKKIFKVPLLENRRASKILSRSEVDLRESKKKKKKIEKNGILTKKKVIP